jgi:hypothetical protein
VHAEFLKARYPMVALYHQLHQHDRARLDLAEILLAAPSMIAEAFTRTIEAMSPYDNHEPFYPRRREHRPGPNLAATKDLALRLGPRPEHHHVEGTAELGLEQDDLDFSYLDRELLITRTTAARRQDGFAPPDHALRLDVLLASNDGSPVVGEIKIKRDRDLTYALIQALACVSLLATAHQRARLQTHYGERLETGGPRRFGIYLIAVPRTDGDTFLTDLDRIALKLAGASLKLEPITAVVDRVALIHATLAQDKLRLKAAWHTTS